MGEEELKESLAAARERRESLEKAREERERKAALARQLAEEQLAVENEEALLKAEELGVRGVDWGTYETPRGIVVLKRPEAPRFKAFQDAGKYTSTALHALVAPCVFYPERRKFEELIEEFPGTLVPCANVIIELASGKRKELEGKS